MLSGGQQARLFTAYYLTGPQQIVCLDESLERTTQSFDDKEIYTRERLINFISYVSHNCEKTIFLLIQGGHNEEELVKKILGQHYLGSISIKGGSATLELPHQVEVSTNSEIASQ